MRKKSFWKFLILCLVLVVIAGASAKILLSDNDVSNGAITDIEGQTVVTVNEISIAIPNDWYDKIIVNPEENFYMTDQTLFGTFKVKASSMYLQKMIHRTIVFCFRPICSQRIKPLMSLWKEFVQMKLGEF